MKNLLLGLLFFPLASAYPAKGYVTKVYKEPHSLGLKRDRAKHQEFIRRAPKRHKAATAVPKAMDLTTRVSPPEDQGDCGACWAFAITKGLRSASMLLNTDPGRLAFNYLLNNCGHIAKEDGCNGGDFNAGENMLGGLGPWLEAQDPYTGQAGRCLNLSPADTAVSYQAVGSGKNPPTFQELAEAISTNNMLIVDVAVCGDWENYASGIFDMNQCGENEINHMINLVGYDCETSVDSAGNCSFNALGNPVNGDGYLKLMNNWGNSWGEDGYMRTRYGIDAVASTAMYFQVSGTPPTPTPPGPPAPPPTPGPRQCTGFLCQVFNCGLPWCKATPPPAKF